MFERYLAYRGVFSVDDFQYVFVVSRLYASTDDATDFVFPSSCIIVFLSVGLYYYPWRREILHTVIFPLIIYGMVFLLWMFWVNRYALKYKKA